MTHVIIIRHWLLSIQVGSGGVIQDRRWSTEWRAPSKWIVVWSAWSTVRCHRSVTRTTTVLRTRPASSTHMPLHSTPTRSTLSLTAPGPGGVRSSATSFKQHRMLQRWNERHCTTAHVVLFSRQSQSRDYRGDIPKTTTAVILTAKHCSAFPCFTECFQVMNFVLWRKLFIIAVTSLNSSPFSLVFCL